MVIVDFTIGLVNSVLNLNVQLASEGFWGELKLHITVINAAHRKNFQAN